MIQKKVTVEDDSSIIELGANNMSSIPHRNSGRTGGAEPQLLGGGTEIFDFLVC